MLEGSDDQTLFDLLLHERESKRSLDHLTELHEVSLEYQANAEKLAILKAKAQEQAEYEGLLSIARTVN